jgi:hypothetical protein
VALTRAAATVLEQAREIDAMKSFTLRSSG